MAVGIQAVYSIQQWIKNTKKTGFSSLTQWRNSSLLLSGWRADLRLRCNGWRLSGWVAPTCPAHWTPLWTLNSIELLSFSHTVGMPEEGFKGQLLSFFFFLSLITCENIPSPPASDRKTPSELFTSIGVSMWKRCFHETSLEGPNLSATFESFFPQVQLFRLVTIPGDGNTAVSTRQLCFLTLSSCAGTGLLGHWGRGGGAAALFLLQRYAWTPPPPPPPLNCQMFLYINKCFILFVLFEYFE